MEFPLAMKDFDQCLQLDDKYIKVNISFQFHSPENIYSRLFMYIYIILFLNQKINTIQAYIKKAETHYTLKEYHKAIDYYERGLKIDPENQDCKQGLAKTQG